ncbi:MAG: histidine kinase [Balneolaceae bacterium]|nr:histidine kinase [Balneolaceae bacterium]MBO6545901.1 histidine kinase [Balneolaceae bacterium]MBO6647297.1 histidine kinase [Balneolaceae bacterium]
MINRLDYIIAAITAFIFTLYHAVLTSLVIARIDSLDFGFGYIFFVECVAFIPLGIAMVVIMWLGKKSPDLFTRLTYKTISKHVLIALTIFIIHSLWQPYVSLFFFDYPYTLDRSLNDFVVFIEMRFLIYVIIVGLVSGLIKIREQRDIVVKQSELNLKLQKARLKELELKMNPEIIYPNLGFIRNKAETQPELASQMVILMAGILRKLVDNIENEQAKLSDESIFFKKYGELLKLRKECNIEAIVKIPSALLNERVPSLILIIPLFEALFFGEYKEHLKSVQEISFTAQKVAENEIEEVISFVEVLDGDKLIDSLKKSSLIKNLNEMLEDLPHGVFSFAPYMEGSALALKLKSKKEEREFVVA